ncbi:hypothetical protein LVY65_04545 [Sphingomonas sp. G124]|uniref:Uncharacterized protein n=1 Tax=Sphingomonas cremea TaxID=2904799 RepID=A0A9X1QJ36_9SPHN|nr:hypothetical protein [Sphingomonas cremea]MCF2514335.1 hypothetical protein [Sphingomonas cremea]
MMDALRWYQAKLFVEHALGVSMDALHILVGFSLFLLVARLLRAPLASPRPLLALLVIELINEAYDLYVERWPSLGSQLGEGFKDVLLTITLPTLILVMARWRPSWVTQSTNQRPGAGQDANQ